MTPSRERRQELAAMSPKERAALYQRLFNSGDGQLVLQDLADRCYVFATTLGGTPADACAREGMRSVMLHIDTWINWTEPEVPATEGDDDAER